LIEKKKKILFVASLDTHLTSFHLPYINWFKDQNYEVHLAYRGSSIIPNVDKIWKIPFERSPFSYSNYRVYKELRDILNNNYYELIHCHTPMASFVTRLAAIETRKKGTKVLYTVHGFHFFKDGPVKNWLLYFPLEKFMSRYTDAIITINREDFEILFKKKFYSKGKYQINGIGLDPKRLTIENGNFSEIRTEKGYSENDFIILYIAEFINRKNHRFVIESIPDLIEKHSNIKFLFAGGGILKKEMEGLVEQMNLTKNVDFLGFTSEISKYIGIADIGISTSKQEGLGLGVAELMYNSKPVIVTQDRGHREMVIHKENGFIFEQNDAQSFIKYIEILYDNKDMRHKFGVNAKKTMEKFMIDKSLKKMIEIYNQYI